MSRTIQHNESQFLVGVAISYVLRRMIFGFVICILMILSQPIFAQTSNFARLVSSIQVQSEPVSITLSPFNPHQAIWIGLDRIVRLTDLSTKSEIWSFDTRFGYGAPYVNFSSDGKNIIVTGSPSSRSVLYLLDAQTGKALYSYASRQPAFHNAMHPMSAFSSDGRLAAFEAEVQGTLLIFDMQSQKILRNTRMPWSFPDLGNRFDSIAFSRDGRSIYATEHLGFAIWDVVSGKVLKSVAYRDQWPDFSETYYRVNASVFSEDARLIATVFYGVGHKFGLTLIDTENSQIICQKEISASGFMKFSREGRFLTVVTSHGELFQFNSTNCSILNSMQLGKWQLHDERPFTSIAISHNSDLLVTSMNQQSGKREKALYVWSLLTPQ